ncbi:beta strand repeat-containing protein [Lichenicola sp.]|uniref:beta strand repeat-containing protein n=1 Tax=Lichenicola sp. TaxID=2804529 RepID=UPI003B00EA71
MQADSHALFSVTGLSSDLASPIVPAAAVPPAYMVPTANPDILTVGAGGEFATLSAALAVAVNGDTIDVLAGTYTNDFGIVTAKVTIQGVGGMANFVATVPPPNMKGILTVDNDVTIRNLSFSGAAIGAADGGNGAGIRYEGGQMVLDHDSFSNNQDGLLAVPVLSALTTNTIVVTNSTFTDNGSGSGYTHNLYVGAVSSLTATNDVFQGAVVGHEFKSRALVNVITDNVFKDGPTGTASYEIDLPDGGKDTITGNLIEKGPEAQNSAMVHFGGEGIPYVGSSLTITGNQFVNDYGPEAVAVLNQTAISASIDNNSFTRLTPAEIVDGPATGTGNVDGLGNPLPDITQVGVLPGNTLVITDNLAHNVTLDVALQAVEGGGGLLTVYAAIGHVIAIGGSGGMNLTESPTSGGNSFATAAGSSNTLILHGSDQIDSEGHDAITAGAGNIVATIGGTAVIQDGQGDNQWTVNGTAAITGHGGNARVSIDDGGQAAMSGAFASLILNNDGGNVQFNITQGGATEAMAITGGASTVNVEGGAMNVATAAGVTGSTLTLGTGTANVQSAGPDTIRAGSGLDTMIVTGQAKIYAGTGTLDVFGRGDTLGATVYGAAGTVTLGGDTGALTYVGEAAANTVMLDLNSNTLIGGTGRMTVIDGSRETIQGGSGGLTILARDGGGADIITTAAGSSNLLQLAGGDIVNSYGNDSISGGGGNQVLVVHGNSLVHGSTGYSTITLDGRDTLVGAGQDTVTVNQGAVATISVGATGAAVETVSETNASVRLGLLNAGATTVTGGSATLAEAAVGATTIATTGHGSIIQLGAGAANVASAAADTITGGSATDAIVLKTAGVHVTGGSGPLSILDQDWNTGDGVTVQGGSGTLSYDQGPGALTFIGGSGAAQINAEYGSANVMAGSGNVTLLGGSAGTSFTAGSGSAKVTLTPNGGAVTFGTGNTHVQEAAYGAADIFNAVAGHGGGTDIITGFRSATDKLVLHGVSIVTASVGSGGYGLSLSDGTHIMLVGVTGPVT